MTHAVVAKPSGLESPGLGINDALGENGQRVKNGHPAQLFRLGLLILEEARPVVVLVFLLRFLVGALFTGGMALSGSFVAAAAGWALVTISVYVLNGVTDVEGDRVNGSSRPLATGRMLQSTGQNAVYFTALLALAAGLLVSPEFMALQIAALILGGWYSVGRYAAKDSPATAGLVVFLGGLLTYFAAMRASDGHLTTFAVTFALAMSSWMAIGCFLKDLPDVEGDALAGRRTLAIRFGPQKVGWGAALSAVLISGAAVSSVEFHSHLVLPAFTLATGAVGLVLVMLSGRGTRRMPYRVFMTTQYVVHGSLITVIGMN